MDEIFPGLKKLAFRIHIDHNTSTVDDVSRILANYEYHACHVVAFEEGAERPHYQGYMGVTEENNKNEQFRKFLKNQFKLKGNGMLSVSTVRDQKKYKKYLLKEGMYRSKGVDVKELLRFQSISYSKDKKKFQELLDEIEIKYLEEIYDDVDYLDQFYLLKAKYRQIINRNYAKQRLQMMIVRKSPKRCRKMAEADAEAVNRSMQLF